ncbi:MAG: TrkH family potassium uptake protein [Burkholderiales bacterium]|nr:TrkH family potassium uptake protein [Burkholderiales bacterium]
MSHRNRTALLQKPVRIAVIGKYLGQLLTVLAILMLLPLLVSLVFSEFEFTVRFVIVEILLLSIGLPLMRIDAPAGLQTNEGLVISALVFMLSPLVMTLPVMGAGLGFIDALFETVSAFTTTGLSVVTDLQQQSRTFLFSRTYMQWIGGLGIVVLTIVLLLRPGIYLRKLVELDESEDIVGSTVLYARRILLIYMVLTVISTVMIWMAGASFFNALTHAFSAVSTGGFSNFDNSLAGFDSPLVAVSVVAGCLFGALPFMLYFRIRRYRFSMILQDVQVRAIVFFILGIGLLLTVVWVREAQMPVADALYHAMLMTVSAQTTAGFASLDLTQIGHQGLLLLMIAMFVGGALGSTAGGIKLYRVLIFWRVLLHLLQKTTATPHAVIEPHLADKTLEMDEINKALLVIMLYFLAIFLSWFAFLFSGYEPVASLFEVVSAAGTVGLSSGVVSVDLPVHLKLVLCLDMLLGRLEFIALLVLVYPATWINRRFNV